MSDKTRIDNGTTGDNIATDDVGGVKHQRMKVEFGDDGSATEVSATYPLPVGVASPPLPTGAATSAKQDTGNSSIDSKTPALGQATAAGSVPVVLTAAQLAALAPYATVSASNFPATQPVSAAPLPLPSGASTEATLALIKAKTDNIDVALSTRTKPADTQTVAGTVTANAGTGTMAVSAASLPLPSGASTGAKQDTGTGGRPGPRPRSRLARTGLAVGAGSV